MFARLLEKLATFFFDVLAINVAFYVTFWLRYKSGWFPEAYRPDAAIAGYTIPIIILTLSWLFLFFFTGLYRDWYKESRLDEFVVVLKTVLGGICILFLITGAPQIMEFARTGRPSVLFTRTKLATLLTYGGCMLFFATVNRFSMHTLLAWLFKKGIGRHNVLIVGANPSGEKLLDELRHYPHMGHNVVGFIDDDGRKKGTTCGDLPVLGTYSEIRELVKKHAVEEMIISEVSNSPNEILRIIEYCGDIRVTIYMVPSLLDIITGHLKTNQVFGVPLMVLLHDHMPGWEAQVKRIVDVAVSLLVLGLGAPFWLLIAAIIKATSAGPAVFRQERIGRNGKPFTMMKFRSMYADAETRTGPVWATEDDPRITPVGKFLRKTRLDEIPQFINVLKGEMSLVGPRPERAYFIEQLRKEIPWYVRRIKMKPGITGWAQVKHKYDASIEDVKQKVMYDLYYFENMSIMLDFKIMFRTIMVVFTGKGAH
ncbi:MAG: exopolysaccharide biosynthesis polyprenyl glycosylphosphotransferase [Chitinivibrionales bacterium]|nr:exopolysaccharide biosynthesis polyprenyl glycosylphosphotransferase [Chitinivibrionales bacterium]